MTFINSYNPYFEQRVGQIHPTELLGNNANSLDTEAPFLDLDLLITNDIVSPKIYDKQDDHNFEIVFSPISCWRCPYLFFLWCIYFADYSFARERSYVNDFNNRNPF